MNYQEKRWCAAWYKGSGNWKTGWHYVSRQEAERDAERLSLKKRLPVHIMSTVDVIEVAYTTTTLDEE